MAPAPATNGVPGWWRRILSLVGRNADHRHGFVRVYSCLLVWVAAVLVISVILHQALTPTQSPKHGTVDR